MILKQPMTRCFARLSLGEKRRVEWPVTLHPTSRQIQGLPNKKRQQQQQTRPVWLGIHAMLLRAVLGVASSR